MLKQGGKTYRTPESSRLAFLNEYRPMLFEKVSELTDNDNSATEWIIENVLEKARKRYSSGPVPSDCSMALLADMYMAYSEYSGQKLQTRKPDRPTARWEEESRQGDISVAERARKAAAEVVSRRADAKTESAERPLLRTTIGKTTDGAPLMRRMSGITPPGASGDYNAPSGQPQAASAAKVEEDGLSSSSKRRRRRSGRRTSVYAYYGLEDGKEPEQEPPAQFTTRAVPVYDIPEPVIPEPDVPEPVIPIPPISPMEDEADLEQAAPQGPKTLIKSPPSDISKRRKNKSAEAVYDENLTQFWSADDEDASADPKASQLRREPEIEKVTLLDDKSTARSVPLTIINTVLLLSLISAAVLLLFQLGLVPRLF